MKTPSEGDAALIIPRMRLRPHPVSTPPPPLRDECEGRDSGGRRVV
jgi:hypothetical protein